MLGSKLRSLLPLKVSDPVVEPSPPRLAVLATLTFEVSVPVRFKVPALTEVTPV